MSILPLQGLMEAADFRDSTRDSWWARCIQDGDFAAFVREYQPNVLSFSRRICEILEQLHTPEASELRDRAKKVLRGNVELELRLTPENSDVLEVAEVSEDPLDEDEFVDAAGLLKLRTKALVQQYILSTPLNEARSLLETTSSIQVVLSPCSSNQSRLTVSRTAIP